MESKENFSFQRGEEPEANVLYVVGTPIGNLNDITKRSLNILEKVSLVACEDTRHTKKLLNAFNIKNKLISFNKYNTELKTEYILEKLREGCSIALVSDAGLPSICDPGEYLVKKVRENNFEVICSPGPCAALTGLISSGLPANNFLFIGFFPKKVSDRKKYFSLISNNTNTTILYESPKRIKLFLKELRNYFEETRIIHISKELTKKHERHWRGHLNKIVEEFKEYEPKGEFTIIIEGKKISNKFNEVDSRLLKKDLEDLLELGLKRATAASYLARKNGISKNLIYNLG